MLIEIEWWNFSFSYIKNDVRVPGVEFAMKFRIIRNWSKVLQRQFKKS